MRHWSSDRQHGTAWVRSHGKKPAWRPFVAADQAQTWRDLNSAADEEASSAASRHYWETRLAEHSVQEPASTWVRAALTILRLMAEEYRNSFLAAFAARGITASLPYFGEGTQISWAFQRRLRADHVGAD